MSQKAIELFRQAGDTSSTHTGDPTWPYLGTSQEKHTCVLRGPMSTISCFTAEHEGVRLYCSHLGDLVRLRILVFSVNWKCVARSLVRLAQPQDTGLREVSGLSGGEAHEIKYDQISRNVYWSALKIASTSRLRDSQSAAYQLRLVAQDCARAWATRYDSLLLLLSGGLDSSIVLDVCRKCLRDHI